MRGDDMSDTFTKAELWIKELEEDEWLPRHFTVFIVHTMADMPAPAVRRSCQGHVCAFGCVACMYVCVRVLCCVLCCVSMCCLRT